MDESRGFLGTLGVGLMVMLFLLLGLTHLARAEDMHDIRGTRRGCVDVTGTAAWVTLTSASLENSTASSALAASLYWTEITVKDGTGAVQLCLNAAASCGADTTNKDNIASGAALTLPLRGLPQGTASGIQSVAVYAGVATTFQVCGYFRVSP